MITGIARLLVIALALLAAGGCRGASGRPDEAERKPPPVLDTPYDDEAVGGEVAEEAGAAMGLVENEALVAYVNEIGQRLALHAPGYRFDYRFQVIDEDAPNAFALPGGYIFVSRGLLALTNSEDELAGVIGHEIAHVAARHASARQQVGGGGILEVLQTPYLAAYGRDLERSADRVGQGLAAVAGYDPAGISDFLKSLDGMERVRRGRSRIVGFLDTHPGSVGRSADAAQRAQSMAWTRKPGVSRDREDHLRRIEGLVSGPSADQGIFDGTRFLHADLGFTLRFPDGWEPINTPQAVGALAPNRRSQVFLEHAGKGRDPAKAASEWAEKAARQGLRVSASKAVRLTGRSAHRIHGTVAGRGVGLTVTFIPWRDQIFRLVGVGSSMGSSDAIFLSVARTFRPMTRELLARVEETRLRLTEARSGESLADLTRRTGNVWSLPMTAVMNGIDAGTRFSGGQTVKIGRSEAYRPKSAQRPARPAAGGEG